MLSAKHKQIVVFRNGTVISPKYVLIGGKTSKGNVYDASGKLLTKLTKKQKAEVKKLAAYGKNSLAYSDTLNNKNLLRYYTPKGFSPVIPSDYNYSTNYQQMMDLIEQLGKQSTASSAKRATPASFTRPMPASWPSGKARSPRSRKASCPHPAP